MKGWRVGGILIDRIMYLWLTVSLKPSYL